MALHFIFNLPLLPVPAEKNKKIHSINLQHNPCNIK
ncbi:hypothetical protein ACB092_12G095000 [Castanea dentata]